MADKMDDMTLDQQIDEYLRFSSGVPAKERATRLRERALRDFGKYCRIMNIKTAAGMNAIKMSLYKPYFREDGGSERMFHRHLIVLIGFFIFAQNNNWTEVNWTECRQSEQDQ